jgi:hypothetical protein
MVRRAIPLACAIRLPFLKAIVNLDVIRRTTAIVKQAMYTVLRATIHTYVTKCFTVHLLLTQALATQPEFFSEELVPYLCH